MIVIAMLLQTLTIDQVQRLPPAEAGDKMLAGRDHRPIDTVVVPPPGPLQPPGVQEVHLIERATVVEGGCHRRRWTATFRRSANDDVARFDSAYASTEVAATRTGGCVGASFVHVNPGLDTAGAIAALHQLDRLRAGRSIAVFSCTDDTASHICARPAALPGMLKALAPWAISHRNGELIFWLGRGGGIVTEVRFAPETPNRVTIDRRVPAPA